MGHPDRRAPIPRRAGLPGERGTLIVSSATHKQKGMFFFLCQVGLLQYRPFSAGAGLRPVP